MNENDFFKLFGSKESATKKINNSSINASSKSLEHHKQPAISDEEIQVMLRQMRKIHDEIESELEQTYQKTGYDPNFIKSFVTNPDNFDFNEWQRIQSERKGFLNSIW